MPGTTARALVAFLYLPLWLVFGVITAVLMLPGAPIALIYITRGIGIILLPVPTIFLYLTAFLPGAIVFLVGLPWWLDLALSVAGALTTAYVPPLMADADAAVSARRWLDQDRDAPLPQRPRHLRVVEGSGPIKPGQELAQAPCKALCQHLLFSEEIDAVEVLAYRPKDETLSVTYRRESLDACPPAITQPRDVLPAVQRAIAAGDCLVPSIGESLPDAPWIRFKAVPYTERNETVKDTLWQSTRGVGRVHAGPPGSSYEEPPVVRHRVDLRVAIAPLAIFPPTDHTDNLDMTWRSRTESRGTDDPLEAARGLFGFTLTPLPGEARRGDRGAANGDTLPPPTLDLVAQRLAQPSDQPFDEGQEDLIRDALVHLPRGKALSADQIATLDALLRDPRTQEVYYAAEAARRDPKALEALLPALVARTLIPASGDSPHGRSRVSRVLANQSPERLRPHAGALLQAAASDDGWGTSALLRVLPLVLDDPPLDLLRDSLAAEHRTRVRDAMVGLCNVAPQAVPADLLDAMVAQARASEGQNDRAIAWRTLVRQGDRARAESLFDRLDPRDTQRLRKEIDQAGRGLPEDGGCTP